MFILPQIAQITQRNAASCIISQRKTGGLRLRLFCCFGFRLRKSARSAGDFGVSIEYSCVFILPQIAQITQRNTASCIISQRKTGCLKLRLFCCFGVCLRKSARSAGDFGVSIEYSCVFILPQMAQITQRNAASCIISQRKTGCLRLRLFCCFGVCLRLSAGSAGDIGVSIEYSYVDILPQITLITQRNTA